VAGWDFIADEVPHRAFVAKELPGEGPIEDGHRLRLLLIALDERSSLEERNAKRVKESHADMVFFPVHLRFREFRVPRNVDRRIPDATGNTTHCERCISDKWQSLQCDQNPLVQIGQVLFANPSTPQVQMHRENMFTIEPCIELA